MELLIQRLERSFVSGILQGENPHVPEQSELDELLKDVGYQKVSLDGDKVTLEKELLWIWEQPEKELL